MQELDSAESAVENADTELSILKHQNDVLREQLNIKEALKDLEPEMDALKQQAANLKDAQALARLQEKRDAATGSGQFAGMARYGADGIIATQRRNQIGRHQKVYY